MSVTRRRAVLAGIGLVAGGCARTSTYRGRRGVGRASTDVQSSWPWPEPHEANPTQKPYEPKPAKHAEPSPAAAGPNTPIYGLDVISRSHWTHAEPIRSRVNLMHGINAITVHHEGWTPVYFTDWRTTAARIEKIRSIHVNDRGWGDIGYHYVVDRAGRVWEARPLKYQGAHVKNHNRHNLGILCLGNFEKQNPSNAQLNSLLRAMYTFRQAFDVPMRRIHSHQELAPTACPGQNLQRRMDAIRERIDGS